MLEDWWSARQGSCYEETEWNINSEDVPTALFPTTDHKASTAIPPNLFQERKGTVQAGPKEIGIGKDP